ncbi:MAG: S8 family serine peptidase [Saprospiraceae bacterium]|nr:S8 family serine peptidase [Saprospiraceae bacterium]
MKKIIYTFLTFAALFSPVFLAAQKWNPDKISKKLLERMASAPNEFHDVHVVLYDQVDLAGLDAELSAKRALPSERSKTVIEALKAKAKTSQTSLLTEIAQSPYAISGSVHSFWVANVIVAKQKNELINYLSRLPEVAWIGLNGQLGLEKVTAAPAPPISPNAREKGISAINAPALWAMGYTGYGQIALKNDTGVDPTAPALATTYRGNMVPAEQAFFDYDANANAQKANVEAFDCQFHGTHVCGTILGLERETNDTIGVAFNAQWMGAASIVCDGGTEHWLATFQWSLDPDGNPATTEDMPDVINNSWYDPGLDTIDCYSVYVPLLEAMEAAGIAVIFSAGNEGPGASTITPPHNVNLNYVNSFTIGAVNGNTTSLPIAGFSSRGPSHCPANDSSLVIKPEVSAPGVDVRSCLPNGGGYGLLSGTSMASPHVSGAVLLLKEAFPYLTGKDIKLALYYTATDLGFPGEDNTYGMGIINVLEAFNYLVAQGNQPVSPYVENDVMIIGLEVPQNACEEEVTPTIRVENSGTATLTQFQIDYDVNGVGNSMTWYGNLAQKERAVFQLPTLFVPSGDHRITVRVSAPNGQTDERALNNAMETNVKVIDRKRLLANVEGSGSTCEGSSALLRAEYSGTGRAEVKWYNAPYGGNLVGQGMAFTTPILNEADTFYAEAAYLISAGVSDKNEAIQAISDEEEGLIFDVEQAFLLKSVKVFAEATGLRQFVLLDKFGEQLEMKIASVSQVGEFEFVLNWEVPKGTGYRIVKQGGKPLYMNPEGINFPLEQPGFVTIKGSTKLDNSYFYFYDWLIEVPETCERTMVEVPVNAGGLAPTASFDASLNTVDLLNNQTVQFTNTSLGNIASLDWNFGDGTGSAASNPSHTYLEAGIYVVSLVAKGQDGCNSIALDTIVVTENGVSIVNPNPKNEDNIIVYPNPASQTVSLKFDLSASKPIEYQISDPTGKTIRTGKHLASQKDSINLDIHDLPTGLFFIQVKMDETLSVWKLLKLND